MILRWLASPEWAAIVEALLHTLWQGAVLAILLGLVLRRSSSPLTRYRGSLAALITVLVCGLITLAALNRGASTANRIGPDSTRADGISFSRQEVGKAGPVIVVAPVRANVEAPPVSSAWTAWLALVWVAGTALMIARAGFQVAGAERLRRSCRPLDHPGVAELVAEARRAIGLARRVRVVVTDTLTSPAVTGLLVPTLILPLTLLTTLTPEQIRFILLHELAHVRRGDYLANLFQLFAEALLFFNPAVWWISHQVRREREACCDALAIELSGTPAGYARTLLRVAENTLNPPLAAPAFGDRREPSSLSERIQRLLVPGYRPSLRLTWRAMLVALVLGGSLLVLSAIGTRVSLAAVAPRRPEFTRTSADSPPQWIPWLQAILNGLSPGTATHGNSNAIDLDISARTNSMVTDRPSLLYQWSLMETNTWSQLAKSSPPDTTGIRSPGSVTLTDGNSSAVVNLDSPTGMSSWSVDGQDALFQQWFWYRVGSNVVRDLVEAPRHTRSNQLKRTAAVAPAARSASSSPAVQTSKYRQVIAKKLDQIRFPKIAYESMPLSEVLRSLQEESRRLDPEQKGINILIRQTSTATLSDSNSTVTVSVPEPLLDSVTIKLMLEDVRLADVLDAIVTVANQPITYSIQDFGVVFSRKETGPAPLLFRKFKVDPNAFYQGLQSVSGRDFRPTPSTLGGEAPAVPRVTVSGTSASPGAGQMDSLQSAVLALMKTAGADLSPQLGKSIFFGDREGSLLVRATEEDLDRIEKLVVSLNAVPWQVQITARFLELAPGDTHAAGLDWLGDAPGEVSRTNKSDSSHALQGNGAANAPTGILTMPQFNLVFSNLWRRSGVKLESEPQVVVLSGQPAQFQIAQVISVATGIVSQATQPPGITSRYYGTNAAYQMLPMSFGRTLDVTATVGADAESIDLNATVTANAFLGYDEPTNYVTVYVDGKKLSVPSPLPHIYEHRRSAKATVWDGQTMVLGGLIEEELLRTVDRTPVLGALPLIGRLFRSEHSTMRRRNFIVFITPTIVDQAGNRANSDQALPHDKVQR